MAARNAQFYVATQTGFVEIDGEAIRISAGETIITADNPLLKAAPDFFRAAEDTTRPKIEAATATPPPPPED